MSFALTNHYVGKKIDKAVSEWLYGEWNEKKLSQFEKAYAIPGGRDYLDYLLDKRADEEYLRRYGMSYNDVHDPRKLRQASSASRMMSSGYRMVSRNVGSLYRDTMYRHSRKRSKKRR